MSGKTLICSMMQPFGRGKMLEVCYVRVRTISNEDDDNDNFFKPRKKYFSKRRSYNVGRRLPTENKCDKRTAGQSNRTRRLSREPFPDLSNEDEDNDNFIQDETIQQEAMSSQDLSNEDEDNDSFIRNGGCPLPRRRRKQFHPTGSITLLLLGKGWILLLFALLASLPQFSCGTNTVGCPTEQYILLKGRAVVKCDGLGDFPSIYWYKNTNNDASAFIQKVNGEVAGTGYTTGEYNIDNEGSLVINNVTIQDDRTFRVKVLDSKLVASSYDVTLIVYAEPAEPIPVIPECSGQSACILKGYSGGVLTCIHGESIPAMEVSWFLRVGTQDRILNATVNQTMSGDSLTFTTSALLAVEKIPIDANMNQLLVVMCKSNLPLPGMKGSGRKILLDFSVDDSLTNETYLDPVYAFERQEDFMINCQSKIDTDSSVVLWMYKSLNSEKVEYILYSAYGEVTFSQHASADFNLTNSGTLVIKQVDIHHEGYFACVTSSENTTESFVQNLVVIVLPNPPIIVVKGCEPFQPCHLSEQEAETVTCTVDGVRPRVDMSIVTYPMNVVVTKTIVSSYEEDGLFYTTIEGRVDVSKKTCGQNVTVICQARGPAAYGFMSDAFVTVPVDKKDCIELSTVTVLPDDDCHTNHLLILIIAFCVSTLLSALCLGFFMRRNIRKKFQPSLEPEPHLNGDMSGHSLLPLREELPYRQKDKQAGPGTIKHHYV